MRSSTVDVPGSRKRPKDRKAQIAQVAAELFCARGYHGVGLEEIAATVGISAPAVYRHFENKYAILVHATRSLVATTLIATRPLPAEDPWIVVSEMVEALAHVAVEHRKTAGLYQWEWRYLTPEHRAEFRTDLGVLLQRMVTALSAARPELSPADAGALARATFSVIGSISTHRAPIPKGRAEDILQAAAFQVLRGEPPTPLAPLPEQPRPRKLQVGSRREVLLAESITLFRRHGYHAVSIEDIGRAAGINASSVYRYFPGKADILAAAFHRASERVTEATAAALTGAKNNTDALHRMIESYVDLTFERSDLVSVYLAENNNLPESDRHELRKAQRLHVEEWVRLVGATRPVTPPEARVFVHAAINVVTDLSRWVHFDRRTAMDHHLVRLMHTVIGPVS
ncbi:TetR/AcrR family transcriptional regulator [Actinoplanes sp. NPDC026619]|uniref:TetR/AcrR family transcriptional regulator n=1 Tax=Actinoplanes sp. NPDC026619 TaxID=3155798 RepID=UPI0033D7DC08